jgi:WD40 repeat protein
VGRIPITRILVTFFCLALAATQAEEFALLRPGSMSLALTFTTQADHGLYSLAWSPDSQTLACGGLNKIWMFSTPNFGSDDPLAADQGEIWGLAWSPSGKLLVSGGINGSLIWWENRSIQKTRNEGGAVYDLAFSPSGEELAVADVSASTKIWNIQGYPTSTIQLDGAGLGVSWAPKRNDLAIGTGEGGSSVVVLNATNAEVRWRSQNVPSHYRAPYGFGKDEVNGVQYSPNGHWIAAALQDGRVVTFDAEKGHKHLSLQLHRPGHGGARRVSWSPDGKWIASCGEDGRVNLVSFSSPSRRVELLNTAKAVWEVAFSPDNRWLAAVGDEGRVWVWDVSNPRSHSGSASHGNHTRHARHRRH